MRRLLPLLLSLGFATRTLAGEAPLQTVRYVDLGRYAGTWYEIAAIPQVFERGCVATQAEYTRRPDGTLQVVNSCRLQTFDGKERVALGRARVADAQTNAKLKVRFGRSPVEGDYWILDLDDNYRSAAVGAPDRRGLWILSRTRQLDQPTYAALVQRAKNVHGFDVDKLVATPQPAGW